MSRNIKNPERFPQNNNHANLLENLNQPSKLFLTNTCKIDKDTKLKNLINSCKNVNSENNKEPGNTEKDLLTEECMMTSKAKGNEHVAIR